jgi:hypothetical protein
MKMKNKIVVLALFACGFSLSSFAQSNATASTTATLVTPISIAKVSDMNFGTVAASATAGTVELGFSNDRTATGGVSLPAGSVDQKTAEFTVTGEGESGFSITLPTEVVLTGSVSGTMTVDNIVADLGTGGSLVAGTATVKVKAILNVPANAVAGVYSNASDLSVTVNYN